MYVLRTVLTRRIGTFFFLTRTFSQEASIETMDWHFFWSGIVTLIQLYLPIEIILHKNKNSTQCTEQGGPSNIWCFFTESIPAGSLAHSSAPYIVVVYNVQFHLLGIAIRLILLALRWEKIYLNQTNGHPLSYIWGWKKDLIMGQLNVQCQATQNFMIIPPLLILNFHPFHTIKYIIIAICLWN